MKTLWSIECILNTYIANVYNLIPKGVHCFFSILFLNDLTVFHDKRFLASGGEFDLKVPLARGLKFAQMISVAGSHIRTVLLLLVLARYFSLGEKTKLSIWLVV